MSSQGVAEVPSPPLTPPPSRDWGASLFVWGVWLGLTAAALYYLGRYAFNLPVCDDWHLVPLLTGKQPLTVSWLWKQLNEHRLPLIKLILLGLGWLTDYDFRAQAFLNVFLLSGLAALLIVSARRLRGHTTFADAFFPLLLLHWGHSECFLFSITLNHVLATVLMAGLLLLVLHYPQGLSPRATGLAGLCLFALPMCGANGLPVVLAFTAWLCWQGLLGWRSGVKRKGQVQVVLSLLTLAWVAFYFVGLRKCHHHPSPPGAGAWLHTSFQCLGLSCLPTLVVVKGRFLWVLPGLFVLSTGLLCWALWRRSDRRLQTLGLLLVLGGALGPALAIGWGRAALGPLAGTAPRYAVVTAPAALAIYLLWSVQGIRFGRRLIPLALFLILSLGLKDRFVWGHHHARLNAKALLPLEQSLLAGGSIDYLADRGNGPLYPDSGYLAKGFRELRDAGIGPYRFLRDETVATETSIDLSLPIIVNQMERKDRAWVATGNDPYLVFTLAKPVPLQAVRLRYRLTLPDRSAFARSAVFWSRAESEPFQANERNFPCCLASGTAWHTRTLWIKDTVQHLRLDPHDGACRFEIESLTLLVSPTQGPGATRDQQAGR
jgi:hypothetical protein